MESPFAQPSEIDFWCHVIGHWADHKFGPKRMPGTILKAYEELGEFSKDQRPEELADAAIVIFDLAYLTNANLAREVQRKMHINNEREWTVDQRTGLAHHVKGT